MYTDLSDLMNAYYISDVKSYTQNDLNYIANSGTLTYRRN